MDEGILMLENPVYAHYLKISLKMVAILCGLLLLLGAAQTQYQASGSDIEATLALIMAQLQNPAQVKLMVGICFFMLGILLPAPRFFRARFLGPRDLQNDAYKLYLVTKYGIERNAVLNQLVCRNTVFASLESALTFAHELEGQNRAHDIALKNVPSKSAEQISSQNSVVSPKSDFSLPSGNTLAATTSQNKSTLRVTVLFGLLLYSVVLGGLFYANSHNTVSTKSVATVTTVASPEDVPAPTVTEPVANNSSANPGSSSVAEPVSADLAAKPIPINERWLGVWGAEGNSQKLSITASAVKYGPDEFTWVGTRPKGVVKCCPAFYEGSTNKAELLTRIQTQQALPANSAIDFQKMTALVNNLGQDNFKKIVIADPFLRKYFFIYDQNYVYRISRDMGDKTSFMIEQFKRQE